jgi:DNA helicase-2/ATP-dependent DNA helicase PcrA
MSPSVPAFLSGLNQPQLEAASHIHGPMMIIAGAGSGKTTVLTMKIANMMHQGVDPFRILALTFTNKAAKEMQGRIEKLVSMNARNLWMGTFHSVFARILRSEAEKLNYPPNFTIYDTDDSKSLLKTIIKEMDLDDKVYKPNSIFGRISSAKNRLITAKEYVRDAELMEEDVLAGRPKFVQIFQTYQSRCFKAGAMDFDDLLLNTNVLFRDHPDVLNKYQHKFQYILVDEYQDTNLSQYLITRKLSAVNRNITVVGDDAQSIYAFRGADIQNILNFEKDFPEARVIRLEQNYRSTQNIVDAANSIIKHNQGQLKKSVWTSNPNGELIELLKATSDNEEGRLVASSIFEEKVQNTSRNKDFAVLYRTNSQSRAIEEALRKMNIRYRIVGGLSFYQRKEIKDLMAYFRFALNPNDEEAFKRIINLPKRGIGDTTVAKIFVIANENGLSLWEVVSNIFYAMSGKAAGLIDSFANLIKSYQVIIQAKDAYEVADHIAKTSGLMRELKEDKSIEGLSRLENLNELLNSIKEFTDDQTREDKTLGAFIQEVSLLTDEDRNKSNDDDVVTLMTIHMAKGLEFKNVFVVGLEENLFPSQMMLETNEDLEEERRLFYVAMTRAEHKLTLSYAVTRYRYGTLRDCEPSRFLKELDQSLLKVSKKFVVEEKPQVKFIDQFKKPTAAQKTIVPATFNHQVSPDFKPSDVTTLRPGMRVEHAKFGFGNVLETDFASPEKKAKIQFEKAGEKTLILSFAKLMICG